MEEMNCCCSGKMTQRTPEERRALLNRLSRIEGQIRGLRGMVEQDAYCADILVQSAAAGAAVNARLVRVVYGAPDLRAGAFGSVIDLNAYPLNHKPEIVGGVLADECLTPIREFFQNKRRKKAE